MALFTEKKEQATTIATAGTLEALAGAKCKLNYNENNFLNPDKALFADVIAENGNNERIFFSTALGKRIREKSITQAELLRMHIIETETQDGNAVLKMIMPQGNVFTIEMASVKAKDYTPVAVNWEDLIAL